MKAGVLEALNLISSPEYLGEVPLKDREQPESWGGAGLTAEKTTKTTAIVASFQRMLFILHALVLWGSTTGG